MGSREPWVSVGPYTHPEYGGHFASEKRGTLAVLPPSGAYEIDSNIECEIQRAARATVRVADLGETTALSPGGQHPPPWRACTLPCFANEMR